MFGESYLGKRIYDTLSVIELLKSKGCEKINLYGNYQGAIIGIFVAFLSDVISKVYLEKLLDSFSALSRKISTGVPSSNLPKGILKITDIPEIIDALKKKKELIIL
jgi:hypothetical protein